MGKTTRSVMPDDKKSLEARLAPATFLVGIGIAASYGFYRGHCASTGNIPLDNIENYMVAFGPPVAVSGLVGLLTGLFVASKETPYSNKNLFFKTTIHTTIGKFFGFGAALAGYSVGYAVGYQQ